MLNKWISYRSNLWNEISFLFVWNGNEKQLKKRWNGTIGAAEIEFKEFFVVCCSIAPLSYFPFHS